MTLREDVLSVLKSDWDTSDWEYSSIDYLFFYDAVIEEYYPEVFEKFKTFGITLEHVTGYGGEGQGDSFWTVYKFTRGDDSVYRKFNGWYASYNGAEFTDDMWVEPYQVTVTKYREVQ